NRATSGGCCECDPGWSGWRCDIPLCHPNCIHGTCIAPDLCHCDAGWKGPHFKASLSLANQCMDPTCDPECVADQGVCVYTNTCECFYGWGGVSCEKPISLPACVNGAAYMPDMCECNRGWAGRICDYPLCQSWPAPSQDCGHGSCIEPYN
ncbi:unnamed protein product, partial [Amoebophrya sp. A25]